MSGNLNNLNYRSPKDDLRDSPRRRAANFAMISLLLLCAYPGILGASRMFADVISFVPGPVVLWILVALAGIIYGVNAYDEAGSPRTLGTTGAILHFCSMILLIAMLHHAR